MRGSYKIGLGYSVIPCSGIIASVQEWEVGEDTEKEDE